LPEKVNDDKRVDTRQSLARRAFGRIATFARRRRCIFFRFSLEEYEKAFSSACARAREHKNKRRRRRKYSHRRRIFIIGFIHRSEHRERTDAGVDDVARVGVKQRSIRGAVFPVADAVAIRSIDNSIEIS